VACIDFKIFDLGLIGYSEAFALQKEIWQKVRDGRIPSSIIICQHYPVITLGRNAKKESILATPAQIKERGIEIIETDRGGKVTYHGPGQLMFYPVFDLNYFGRDIHLFLKNLEAVVIAYLEDFGIKAKRLSAMTGVWVNDKKICSIGIAIRHWITYHGLSINVNRNCLNNFGCIKPCGMNIQTTCVEDVLDRKINIERVKKGITQSFVNIFALNNNTEVLL